MKALMMIVVVVQTPARNASLPLHCARLENNQMAEETTLPV